MKRADGYEDADEVMRNKLGSVVLGQSIDEVLRLEREHADACPLEPRQIDVHPLMWRHGDLIPLQLAEHHEARVSDVAERRRIHDMACQHTTVMGHGEQRMRGKDGIESKPCSILKNAA